MVGSFSYLSLLYLEQTESTQFNQVPQRSDGRIGVTL